MGMPATRTDWTVDMLDALEDDGQRYELIDGELFVTPSPALPHQLVAFVLATRLHHVLAKERLGTVVMSPSDIRRGDHQRNRVQPDVSVVRGAPGAVRIFPLTLGDVVLAIEVVSPSSKRFDYEIKRTLYLNEGVAEYWIVEPIHRYVTRWRAGATDGERVTDTLTWTMQGLSSPLTITLPELFAEALD
jgi:Uma2 family endonuclease